MVLSNMGFSLRPKILRTEVRQLGFDCSEAHGRESIRMAVAVNHGPVNASSIVCVTDRLGPPAHRRRFAPKSGPLIPGGRDLRKIRRPLPGRGKSGGARIIYYYVASDSTIYLVFAYAKCRQADLTKAQLHELSKFVHSQIP